MSNRSNNIIGIYPLFRGIEEFEKLKIKDNIKTTFCEKNGIFLLRISYKENIEEKLKWLMNYLKTITPKD